MSKEKKNTVAGEQILKTVTEQLTTSLTSLKMQLGEKKFNKRIKKAAKLLIDGIGKKPVKKVIPKSAKKLVVKVLFTIVPWIILPVLNTCPNVAPKAPLNTWLCTISFLIESEPGKGTLINWGDTILSSKTYAAK